MATISVWQKERDYKAASETFKEQFETQLTAQPTQRAAEWLSSVAPSDVIDRLKARSKKCWDRYRHILDSPEDYLPDEVDEATKAVKKCVCRELRRIFELEGKLPEEWQEQWEQYGCAANGS